MIYFMQPVGGGPVKIGFSDNVTARRKQLESRFGVQLVVLAIQDGNLVREKEIHRKFDHLALGWEQFRPASDLMEFIGVDVASGDECPGPMVPRDFDPNPDPTITKTKIDRAIVSQAQEIAKATGESVTDIISDAARANVARAYLAAMERLRKTAGDQ